MSGTVLLRVPAALAYRELACRTVAAVCKLSQGGAGGSSTPTARRFTNELVSAVGEAFNNVVFHAYADANSGTVELELAWNPGEVVVEVRDQGRSFDFDAVPLPDLDSPQEKGMGVFIIRSFVDRASYRPGSPNVLVLSKRCTRAERLSRNTRRGSGPNRSAAE